MLNAIKLYDINRIRKPSNVCGWPSVENAAIKHNPMLVLCWERLPVAKNRRLWAPWLVLGLLSIAERADRPSINTHTVRHANASKQRHVSSRTSAQPTLPIATESQEQAHEKMPL